MIATFQCNIQCITTLLAQHLQPQANDHNTLKPRPIDHSSWSPGQLIATCRNIVGCNMLVGFGHAVVTWCDMLLLLLTHIWPLSHLANNTQHVATWWPSSASNNVAIFCIAMLRSFVRGLTKHITTPLSHICKPQPNNHNISQHCWAQHVWLPCCGVLQIKLEHSPRATMLHERGQTSTTSCNTHHVLTCCNKVATRQSCFKILRSFGWGFRWFGWKGFRFWSTITPCYFVKLQPGNSHLLLYSNS